MTDRALRVALVVALVAATASCTRVAAPRASSAANVLRIGLHSEPHNLSPILPQHAEEFNVARLYSDVLTSFDARGRLVPMLAVAVPTLENGGISSDGRTITYRLRRNVRWQDGRAFTSADVAFTWHAIMNPRNDVVSRDGYDRVARVETLGPFRVRFHLKSRFAPIVAELFGDGDSPLGMLPEHLLGKEPELNDVPYDALPIGTGPYRVVKWIRGDRIELVANPDYYLGKPKIARITLFFSPDENTLVERLRTHEIDWLPEASPAVVPLLTRVPGIRTVFVDQNHWFGIWFNLRSATVSDVRVRTIVAAAVDKMRLTRTLTFGTALPATGDLPSFLWAYPHGVAYPSYDRDAARRELAALERPLPVIALAYDQSSDVIRATAVALQSELAAAGIRVQLRGYRREVFLGPASEGGILTSGHYEMALGRWLYGPDPDSSGEFSCAAIPPNGYNLERYCNPVMDAYQREALDRVARAARAIAYAKIERLVARDVPILPLWWPRAIHVLSRDVEGFAPNGLISTWNAWEWRLGGA